MGLTYPVFSPAQAVSFHRRLGEIRTLYLGEALGQTVAGLDIPALDAELASFVPLPRWRGSRLKVCAENCSFPSP